MTRGSMGTEVVVSVVVPAYNCARFIGTAVRSVLDQVGVPLEVIIVDDGSTDDTAHALAPLHEQIRVVRHPNRGQSITRNRGMELARGRYVLFLDGDDYLLPGTLAALAARLDRQPSLGLVQGGTREVDAEGHRLRDAEPWRQAPRLDLERCVRFQPVQLGAMLMRREWPERIGGFDPSQRRAADVDFLLRLALAGCPMTWLTQPVLCYRQHDRNMTRDAVEQGEGLTILLDKFFARPDVPARIRRLERSVRFHGLVWSAWRMSRTGQVDAIPAWLARSLAWTPYAPEDTAREWLEQFAAEDAAAGGASTGVATWRPVLQQTAAEAALPWANAEALLAWWSGVWAPYLDDDTAAARQGLDGLRPQHWNTMLTHAHESLRLTPPARRVALAEQLTTDAATLALAGAVRARDVTSLHLTTLGLAAHARDWTTARHALRRAVACGRDLRVVPVWGRVFGRSIVQAAQTLRRADT